MIMKVFVFLIFALIFGAFGTVNEATAQPRGGSSNSATAPPVGETQELLKAGVELYEQKKYDEALGKFSKAAQLSPKDFRPHFLTGIVYQTQLKFKEASDSFAKAIELQPDNKVLYYSKARADYLRNERDAAVITARQALKIDPAYVEAYVLIGDALRFDDKRSDEALEAYRAAIKINPKAVNSYESLGELFQSKKDEKAAEEMFRKAMELDENRMSGRFPLGRMMVKQGRLKEARELWEGRTTDKDNTFPNFIDVLARAENLQQATERLAQNPNDPNTLLEMGNAVMKGDSWVVDGRQERAVEYFRQALKIKPDFAEAQAAIVKAYIEIADTFKKENPKVAVELAKLKRMNAKLAKEMEEYRRTYSGGLKIAAPPAPK